MKQIRKLVPAFAAALLAACGGGGTGSVSSTFTGKIIDGYIANAIVCVDLDSSLTCDSNEPTTRTNADGSYTLPYIGANPVGLPILAIVAADSKDADDGGLTLAEAGKSSFNLASPITKSETSEVMVSPLTTLVMHNVLAGSAGAPTESSILAAETQVKKQLGISKDILGLDVTKDAQLHQVAQVISVVLGDVTKAASTNSKSAQLEAGTALVESILPVIFENGTMNTDVSRALASTDRKQVVANLKTQLDNKVDYTTSVITGSINNIALGNKLPGQETVEIKQVLATGFGSTEIRRFNLYDPTEEMGIGNYTAEKYLRVNFQKFDATTNQLKKIERHWYAPSGVQSAWVRGSDWGDNYALNSAGAWVISPDDFNPSLRTPTFNGNCITMPGIDSKTGGQTVCMTQVNVSGKKVTELLSDVCESRNGITPSAACSTATFAEGSIGYNITWTNLNDTYKVDVPRRSSNAMYHYGNQWGAMTPATTITEFITMMLSKPNDPTYKIGIWDDFSLKFISYDEASGGGDVKWYYKNETESSGVAKFYVKTVNGQKVIVLPPVARYHKENPGEMVGQDFIFAAVNNKIRFGTSEYANTKANIKFGGYTTLSNSKALDSILNAVGVAAFPYDQAAAVTTGQ